MRPLITFILIIFGIQLDSLFRCAYLLLVITFLQLLKGVFDEVSWSSEMIVLIFGYSALRDFY